MNKRNKNGSFYSSYGDCYCVTVTVFAEVYHPPPPKKSSWANDSKYSYKELLILKYLASLTFFDKLSLHETLKKT